jgi:hypothetical protein
MVLLKTSIGKGLFYILIGCLCFENADVFCYIVAALVIGVGIFILFCSTVDGKPQGADAPESEYAYETVPEN